MVLYTESCVAYTNEFLGQPVKVFHGSVGDMPFDQALYDGIFCHALIHLLGAEARQKLIADCYSQLNGGGTMVFTAITKHASTYGVGEKLGKDRFKTKDGVDLFFYDSDSIQEEFAEFGMVEAAIIEEVGGKSTTRFWQIVCRNGE